MKKFYFLAFFIFVSLLNKTSFVETKQSFNCFFQFNTNINSIVKFSLHQKLQILRR